MKNMNRAMKNTTNVFPMKKLKKQERSNVQ